MSIFPFSSLLTGLPSADTRSTSVSRHCMRFSTLASLRKTENTRWSFPDYCVFNDINITIRTLKECLKKFTLTRRWLASGHQRWAVMTRKRDTCVPGPLRGNGPGDTGVDPRGLYFRSEAPALISPRQGISGSRGAALSKCPEEGWRGLCRQKAGGPSAWLWRLVNNCWAN